MARRKRNILEELETLEKEACETEKKMDEETFDDLEIDEAKEKEDEIVDDLDAEGGDEADAAEGDDAADAAESEVEDIAGDLESEVSDLEDDAEKDDMADFKEKLNQILDSISDLKAAISGDDLGGDEMSDDMGDEEVKEEFGDEMSDEDDTVVEMSSGEEEELYRREDFTPLFSKEVTLTESFKNKANAVFNSVLQEKVLMVAEKVAAKANRVVNKKVKNLLGTMVEDVNDYFDYVVEEWMSENELAVEQGIRNNLIENVLFKFKKALAESYIELPEEDLLMIEELEKKTNDLQTKLDGVLTENIKLRKHLVESKKKEVLSSLTEGLTAAEVDRFKRLSKSVDFESLEQYKDSLKTLKESVVKTVPVAAPKSEGQKEKVELKEEVAAPKSEFIDISSIDPTKMFTDIQVTRSVKINEYVGHLDRAIKA